MSVKGGYMNIFVTNSDPKIAASHLDDKRVNKMIIETVQMLSLIFKGPYKQTHANHPCSKWVRESDNNLQWTIEYLDALYHEHKARTGKEHLSYIKFKNHLKITNKIKKIQTNNSNPIEFCNCSAYKDIDNVFLAYQLTLADKWETDKRTPTWYGVGR